jgi:glutamate-1-semialdehyde 2,1-aminomutase
MPDPSPTNRVRRPQDAESLRRAMRLMPQGLAGFHRLVSSEQYPSFLVRGEGACAYDADGNRYIDYVLGKGPLILGYAHPAVQRAVHAQIDSGNLLSLSPLAQLKTAELLLELFPGDHQVRFHKSGSDACEAAARMARVFTGRTWILSAGYHGWHDWCSPGSTGVPPQATALADFHYDLNELERLLAAHPHDVAAIFVEPQPGFLEPGFYRELRRLADAAGALLLFDEVKTGLRVEGYSVQHATGVKADLFTLSKALSNGFCLSCVIGRRDILEVSLKTHLSGTYDIEATPFAAAAETLTVLRTTNVMERLRATCSRLVHGLNRIFRDQGVPAKAFAADSIFRIGFAEEPRETFFYGNMAERGVLLYPYDNQFVSLAHDEGHVSQTLEVADEVIRESVRALPPAQSHESIVSRGIHQFQNRKGYLKGAPGPAGR